MKPNVILVMLLVVAACGGAAVGPGGTATPYEATEPDDTPYNGPAPGAWTGTITVRGVIDIDKTEDGSSGDPGSTYYETYTTHDVTQADATDTFTITANDPDDITYGIDLVDLGGSAANAGTTLERYTTTSDKQNSGCTWTEEVGTETTGSWTGSGAAVGSLRFSEDGSYSIEIGADTTGPDGFAAEGPKLPHRIWDKITDLSAGCEGDSLETTATEGPIVEWASSFLGSLDVNNIYARIDGQMDAANPGSVVDGEINWELSSPEGMTLTITWHLVHDGPISLPHD